VPGFTNRVLGKLVKVVFIACEDAAKHFPAKKVVRSSHPVRQKIVRRH
jgi:UDP-N-acetylglucosamine--N-acetylmuramyl-(pentapeptide) pyrophosphoryl-undecaprenol N-acetylglucosamine transferase